MSQALQPTDEQAAIIAAASGPRPMMVEAYAGCAKSSSLEMAAPQIRGAALATAFNKKNAGDLAKRLPGNFNVKTLNGLGHGALLRGMLSGRRVQIEDRKIGKLLTQWAKDQGAELSSEQWDWGRQLVQQAMLAGLVPGDQGSPLTADLPETWAELAGDIGIPSDEQGFVIDLAKGTLGENNRLTREGLISFDDQVYASVCLGGRFNRYGTVFVDEAQDLSALNHAMIGRSLSPGGKLVAVGDRRQAIYQFRGADGRSMDTMRQLTSGWEDHKLTLTFRCPKLIVQRQQRHAPGFRAAEGNAQGHYQRLGGRGEDEPIPWYWQDLMSLKPTSSSQVAILCRNNAPLFKLAFRLLRRQTPVIMAGRDIGKGLISLARKLSNDDPSMSAERLTIAIEAWREREHAIAMAKGKEAQADSIQDRAECLHAVLEGTEAKDAGQLVHQLEVLFSRESAPILLSSIHKAKGLEWDLVVHLDPWRIPSRAAKIAAMAGKPEALEQEWNLAYVAETRTRSVLVEADLEGLKWR